MLVAEKIRYYEEMEPYIEHPRIHKEEPKSVTVAKPKTFSRVTSIFMVMLCFAAASFVVFRYAVISENHNKIMALKSTLEKEYDMQERLKVDLAFSEDLNNIEFAAMANLGMNYPQDGQVLYVDLPAPSILENVKVAEKPISLWSRLFGFSD